MIFIAAVSLLPRGGDQSGKLTILYPYPESLFPPEIAPTAFIWKDEDSGATAWKIRIEFENGGSPVTARSNTPEWTPSPETWEKIKNQTLGHRAMVTIRGTKGILPFLSRSLTEANVSISTSPDSVGAPVFYRDVPLPFNFAKEKMELIQWRMGDISKSERPPVVLENLPVCGNCHSFNRDASMMAMDVDSGGDKGAYAISPVEEEIFLTREKLITWNDFRRKQGAVSFGLLAQISPDGQYVATTVEDRVVFLGKEGGKIEFSQLFFPVKGIIAYYDCQAKQIRTLPGADDPNWVQSNPSWSPDGKYIIFARASLRDWIKTDKTKNIVLSLNQSAEFLGGEEFLQDATNAPAYPFSLYRIPFNGGKGGQPEPVPGASENGVSNYFARYSPDGKWIAFCKARSFMLLQPDSRLWIMPADYSAPPREMKYNTGRMNSWHSWSPNSRWLVFSSKEHSPYTELFLKHIDENGNDSPPVRLSYFSSTDRARNIPEFVNIRQGGIHKIHESFVDYYSYVRKGEKLEEFEKWAEAEDSYRKSLEMNPDFAETHRKLAYLLMRRNAFDEAQRELEIARNLLPKDPLAYQNLGEVYLARQDYGKAREEFQNCLKLNPKYSPAYSALGLIYLAEGNKPKAQASLETAVQMDKDNADAQYTLCEIYMEQKNYTKAEQTLREAMRSEKFDYNPEAYTRLGTIHLFKEELDKAEKAFLTALKLEPDNSGALHNLGIIYLQQNDPARAEQAFRSVYRLNPENPGVCLMLAQVIARNPQGISEAISLYNQAISLDPRNTQAYIDLGNLYLKAGDRANAARAVERAAQLNPTNRNLRAQADALKRQ
jgi:tetratricopeptide (TPR) repeat protein